LTVFKAILKPKRHLKIMALKFPFSVWIPL